MRNVLGAGLFLAAAVFLLQGWALRRRVLAGVGAAEWARHRAAALADPRSMAAFGEIARPLVLFGLAWLGLKSTVLYVLFGGERVLSWFDLGGFLALLAAYGVWFSLRATSWLPEQAESSDVVWDTAQQEAPPSPPVDRAEERSARRAA